MLAQRYAETEPHTLAGYTVHRRGGNQTSFLVKAREDLVTIYEALGAPEQAAPFASPDIASGAPFPLPGRHADRGIRCPW